LKHYLNIACLICFITVFVNAQDTINFKAFDSLKTSAEDKHKHVVDTGTVIVSKRNLIDSTRKHIDTTALKKLNLDRWYKGNQVKPYSDPDNWDVRLFRKINNARSPFKDRFFDTFDRSMLPISLILPASMFIYGRAYNKTYDENSAYLLASAEFTNLVLTFGTKVFVKRERPLNKLPHCYIKGKPTLDVYSFPSGHTSTTFSIATMFALRYTKYPQVYVPMYAWAMIVAYARPYFAMHYPSDLLAGAVYGTGSSILIYSLRKELLKLKNSVLGEDKKDEGSIKDGVVSLFVGSFIASSLVNNFIFKPSDRRRLFISPWMDNHRSGVNINYKF
jgi:membrane-associated phospholipid phosphatase